MKTLIGIQDEYIAKVNAGAERWAHRKDGGHLRRIRGGARRNAHKELAKLGYSHEAARQIIDQASEVAELERMASE